MKKEREEIEEDIDLSDDDEETDLRGSNVVEEDELTPEARANLKARYLAEFGEEANETLAQQEKTQEDNIIVINASKERLKKRLKRVFDVYLIIAQHDDKSKPIMETVITDGEEVERQKCDSRGKPLFEQIKEVMRFKIKRPTDKERLDLERVGIKQQEDLKKLTDKETEKANKIIAKYLSRIVLDPVMTADEWRTDVDQAIYQSLVFRVMTAAAETNDTALVDFFTNV